jgi:hypothetical protein
MSEPQNSGDTSHAEDSGIAPAPNETGEKVLIRRGKVDSLTLYEITDYELSLLESGSPASLLFNFSILLLSTAVSFLVTLLATEIRSDRIFTVFTIVVAVGFAGGLVLMFLWLWFRRSTSGVIQRIKSRIPSEEVERPSRSKRKKTTRDG